jgi:hypothetical protein
MEELHTIPTMEIQHPLKGMFVNEKIAKVLKDKGFNEPCFAYYRLNHVNDDYMFHIVGEYSGNSSDWYVNYVGTGLTNNEMQRNPIGRLKQCFTAPLYQQVVDFFDAKELLVGIIVVDNKYKFTLNVGNYISTEFADRITATNEAIIYAISYL